MKSVNLIFRRTHLYLGMLLIPWMFVYAFSTFMLNHGPTFRPLRPGPDAWIELWQKQYPADPPQTEEGLRTWAGRILEEHGLSGGPFHVQRNPQRVIINAPRFIKPLRLTYDLGQRLLTAEQRPPSWVETFIRLHFRAGYGQVGPLQKIWGFIVDLVCISFLVWVFTGLYLWWKIPQCRAWGWLAIAAGFISFASILWAL